MEWFRVFSCEVTVYLFWWWRRNTHVSVYLFIRVYQTSRETHREQQDIARYLLIVGVGFFCFWSIIMTEIYALKSYEAHEHLVSEAKRQLKLAYHYWCFTKHAYKFLVRKMVFETMHLFMNCLTCMLQCHLILGKR